MQHEKPRSNPGLFLCAVHATEIVRPMFRVAELSAYGFVVPARQ
jgi:hypothetical protein